jgi:hypothetical protein
MSTRRIQQKAEKTVDEHAICQETKKGAIAASLEHTVVWWRGFAPLLRLESSVPHKKHQKRQGLNKDNFLVIMLPWPKLRASFSSRFRRQLPTGTRFVRETIWNGYLPVMRYA